MLFNAYIPDTVLVSGVIKMNKDFSLLTIESWKGFGSCNMLLSYFLWAVNPPFCTLLGILGEALRKPLFSFAGSFLLGSAMGVLEGDWKATGRRRLICFFFLLALCQASPPQAFFTQAAWIHLQCPHTPRSNFITALQDTSRGLSQPHKPLLPPALRMVASSCSYYFSVFSVSLLLLVSFWTPV